MNNTKPDKSETTGPTVRAGNFSFGQDFFCLFKSAGPTCRQFCRFNFRAGGFTFRQVECLNRRLERSADFTAIINLQNYEYVFVIIFYVPKGLYPNVTLAIMTLTSVILILLIDFKEEFQNPVDV